VDDATRKAKPLTAKLRQWLEQRLVR
jgi:hypothetical protein